MKTKAIPEDFHSLIPDLVVHDVAEAIEYYRQNVFSPQSPGGGRSISIFLYVEDVDSVFTEAISAHRWMLATHIKDLSDEEIEEAGKAMFTRNPE